MWFSFLVFWVLGIFFFLVLRLGNLGGGLEIEFRSDFGRDVG